MYEIPSDRNRRLMRSFAPPISGTVAISAMVILDTIAVLLAGYVSYDSIIVYAADNGVYFFAVTFVWLVVLSLLNFGSMYQFEAALHPLKLVGPIVASITIAFLFFLATAFSLKFSETLSRVWVSVFALSTIPSLIFLRLLLALALKRLVKIEGFRRNLAIVGEGTQAERFRSALAELPHQPLKICGMFSANLPDKGSDADKTKPEFSGLDLLVEQARLGQIDDVAISLPWSQDDAIMECVEVLRELPVNVYLVDDLVGFRTRLRPAPTHFGSLPISEIISKPMAGWDSVIKAIEDYVLGITIAVLIAPLLAIVALAVKLDSDGPILFKQKRLGFNNRTFNVYKFRTMFHAEQPEDNAIQATERDPRVTRLGGFLRRSSIDELPQVFNVLNGTMSIVGPRPHALNHNEEFSKRMQGYFARHRVKPGITGLAQIKGFRGPTDTTEKLEGRIRNDIYYAENWTLVLDFHILTRTLFVAVLGKNAY